MLQSNALQASYGPFILLLNSFPTNWGAYYCSIKFWKILKMLQGNDFYEMIEGTINVSKWFLKSNGFVENCLHKVCKS